LVVWFLATEAGADVNAPSEDGATPLSVAASKVHKGVVRILATEAGADNKSLNHSNTELTDFYERCYND